MIVSYAPIGSHHCGDTKANGPAKPRGVTPTTVKSRPLIRTVLPMNPASNCRFRHCVYDAIATRASAPGCSSAAVNGRPAGSDTPSVSK